MLLLFVCLHECLFFIFVCLVVLAVVVVIVFLFCFVFAFYALTCTSISTGKRIAFEEIIFSLQAKPLRMFLT